ncbi:MAG TPA: hypothetical protein VGO11_17410 [Chthoniobacteraceae bacterium]|nr:hypothetical protein [Chthoniobacteraceae bacterium]
MNAETADTAKTLSLDERRARLAALVESGAITAESAAMIEFRDPPAAVREYARQLGIRLKAREQERSRAVTS